MSRPSQAASTLRPGQPAVVPPQPLNTLADLPPSTYRVLLLDQFGVLHDGRTPYPGAIDAVRADAALAKLQALGFDRSWFAGGAVTSGEVAHDRLLNRPDAWWRALGHRVLHVTWGARGAVSLDGLNLTLADAATADFILAHGTEAVAQPDGSLSVTSLDGIKDVLRVAATRSPPPPFLCANPDLVTVDGGELRVMPGTLAAFYKEICADATVVLLGKPVGDSLEHDVAGAAVDGIDALYIGGGIHAKELGVGAPPSDGGPSPPVDAAALAALLKGRPAEQWPRYVKAYLAP